jgi:hypothetical protein
MTTTWNRSDHSPRRAAALWGAFALAMVAALAAQPAAAADYVLSGQVRMIDSIEAADDDIADADLTLGDPLPFVKVAIIDRATGNQLADGWTGQNGQYGISFTAGSPADVEAQVFLVADGGLTPLPAAREGINDLTLTSLGGTTLVGLLIRVESDLLIEAGLAALPLPYAGVGIVFTRVGKVEIPYIEQSLLHLPASEIGLADMSGDLATADQLGLPDLADQSAWRAVFRQAPFGRRLMIFGSFGQPGGAHPTCALPIDMYQVTIETLDPATLVPVSDFVWTDPMSKKRYEVQTFPFVNVSTSSVNVGPYFGKEGVTDVPGLYFVFDDTASPGVQTFYSFPDLRVNWVSNGHNGLFRLRMRYFHRTGWDVPNVVPEVTEIDSSCFAGPFPPEISDSAVHQLVLRVDNRPLHTRFNHIYLRNAAGYLAAGGGRVPTPDLAFDFNDDGLCDIMHFEAGDQVEIDFTARHDGGYLRYYRLSAHSNDGSAVPFAGDDFVGQPTLPLWHGTPAPAAPPALPTGAVATNTVPFPHDCAYIFHLAAASRVQNGYNYVQSSHPLRTYYVDLP